MTRVSVLMPCYNTAATLEEALESLARQTLDDFEVVAVDDGSTDETAQILARWAGRDPRLRVIARPHAGIIAALNAGLEACRAEWVARMDADDIAYPQRLAVQAAYLAEHPETDVVGCRVEGFPAGQVREGFRLYLEWLNSLVEWKAIGREIFVESPLAHPSVMFRRKPVQAVGGYQEHGWPEDYDLWLRLYLAGRRFAKTPDALLGWRERPERLTRCDPRYSLENFLRLKACYLARGPLAGREAVLIWGAGMMGRRLVRQLERLQAPLAGFFDLDPKKIGRVVRGLAVRGPGELLPAWRSACRPVILAAVGARGARPLIRARMEGLGLVEGQDWWLAA